jgi:acyl carrier protein
MVMSKNDFYLKLEEILAVDVGTLTDDVELASLGVWDSVSVLSTITLVDQCFKVVLDGTDVGSCKTAGEIYSLVLSKI